MVEDKVTERKFSKKPSWLKVKLPTGEAYTKVRKIVSEHKLHTICSSGNCPNMGECWGAGTATFMILGNICTRSCGFCAVKTGRPLPADLEEPMRVANSVKLMKVKHCVITSVDRDDLKDGGSIIWEETVNAVRELSPTTTLETLVPDFKGDWDNLQRIIDVAPEIVSLKQSAPPLSYGVTKKDDSFLIGFNTVEPRSSPIHPHFLKPFLLSSNRAITGQAFVIDRKGNDSIFGLS